MPALPDCAVRGIQRERVAPADAFGARLMRRCRLLDSDYIWLWR